MKENTFNPWFHILYWGIIIVLIGIFIVLVAPTYVTERAMDNISFASAVVSIVLAVVSIVWSIISGHSSLNRQNAISSIETDISQRLVEFKGLEKEIKEALSDTGDKVEKVRAQIASLSGAFDASGPKKKGKAGKVEGEKLAQLDFPNYAVYALYAACSASKKERPISLKKMDTLPDTMGSYFSGFWVALDRVFPEAFSYSYDDKAKTISIVKFDNNEFGSLDSILEYIKKRGEKDIVSKIDEVIG